MMLRLAPVRALAMLALAAATPAAAATYVVEPAKSSLVFTFEQAGAESSGRFVDYSVNLAVDDERRQPTGLDVTVKVASLDTQDQERDDTLRGADLFDVEKFPTARFVASTITPRGQNRYEALGRLTIRGVSRDARVPFTFQTSTEGGRTVAHLKGETVIRRLDFGVGQGEWKSTEWVGNEVKVAFDLRLVPAASRSAAAG